MAKKKRTYNTRRIKRDFSYEYQEIAALLGVHKNAVGRWATEGLEVMKDAKPYLVYGGKLIDFLNARQSGRKQKCAPNEVWCCKCRAPRRLWENVADIVIRNQKKLSISGLCAVCETPVNQLGSVRKLPEYRQNFNVQTISGPHIKD
ncbi:MAG: hypothetical protein EOM12_10190 [Verrucomicrobiae bacterium]|nr:hypothetical protein [Verrucomicrobiae bacterium]